MTPAALCFALLLNVNGGTGGGVVAGYRESEAEAIINQLNPPPPPGSQRSCGPSCVMSVWAQPLPTWSVKKITVPESYCRKEDQ